MWKTVVLVLALGGSEPSAEGAPAADYRPAGFDYPAAANNATSRVMARIEGLFADVRSSEYSHRRRIDRAAGHYAWDCSAMVNWVLARMVGLLADVRTSE